jgi:hypothetical protein
MQRLSIQQLRKLISEEVDLLDHETTDEVNAIEDVWGGDITGDDKNLVLPLDHSKAGGGPEVTRAPEMNPNATPVLNNENKVQVYRGTNDVGKSYRIPMIVLELYYDAHVNGNTPLARSIIEEHLDIAIPGWHDYEWKA